MAALFGWPNRQRHPAVLAHFRSVEIQARKEECSRPSWGRPDVFIARFSGLLAQFEPDGMSDFKRLIASGNLPRKPCGTV